MLIAVVTFTLRAPWVHSLKEKRMIVKSLVSRMQSRFHVSAAETGKQDMHNTIVISAAAIAHSISQSDSIMNELSAFVEGATDAEIIEEERRVL